MGSQQGERSGWVGRALVGVLLADLVLVLVLGTAAATPHGRLVLRDLLFAGFDRGGDLFALSPEALVERGFQVDAPDQVAEWSTRVAHVPYREVLDLEGLDEVAVIRALVPAFSKNGGRGCGGHRDLMHQVERLPEGTGAGCCSDHTQVLMAHAASLGIFAREVHHGQPVTGPRHTTAEFFVPSEGRWIWVDPQYAILARGSDGALLSFAGLAERRVRGDDVIFEFIGNEHHRFATESPATSRNYRDPDGMRTLGMTFGNAVFSEEAYEARVRWLPKNLRRFVGLASGAQPAIHYRLDAEQPAWSLRVLRSAAPVVRLAIPLLAIATPLLLFAWLRARRSAGDQVLPGAASPGPAERRSSPAVPPS